MRGVNISFVFVMTCGWSDYEVRWTSTARDIYWKICDYPSIFGIL